VAKRQLRSPTLHKTELSNEPGSCPKHQAALPQTEAQDTGSDTRPCPPTQGRAQVVRAGPELEIPHFMFKA
jgi:hypothetical protein